MRITCIELVTIKLEDRAWSLFLVHTDAGLTGIGRGGDPHLITRELAPLLVGQDPRRTAFLWHRMYETAWRPGGPGRAAMPSIGALDVALWDLCGKASGQPVWRLLGGYRDEVPAYADGAGYADVPDQSPAGIASQVEKHAGQGYEAFKIHMYRAATPQEVVERVRLSRERLGPDKKLMIDLHAAWEGRLAVEVARQLEPYDLYWIEEPVRRDDEPHYLRMVQGATRALVVGGEGEGTLYGIRRLLTEGALQVVQTDILVGGGYTGLLRIAALAEAFHLPVAPHGAQYPDINCHLAAAVPNGLIVPACPSCEPSQIWSRLYDPPFQVQDGRIALTEKPGLGLELDQDFVERYRV